MTPVGDIPENNNWVFLLGAGFSAPYDCPVMNGFMERARTLYFRKRRDYAENQLLECHGALLKFQTSCLNSSWAFNRNWENIEELYTQADLLRLAGQQGAKELCDKIAWSIWDVYRGKFDSPTYLKLITEKLKSWNLRPVFITTNYDTIIEVQLGEAYCYPGFEARRKEVFIQALEAKPDPNVAPVIKLHGSANWFQTDDECGTWVGVSCALPDTHSLAHHSWSLDLARYKQALRQRFAGDLRNPVGADYSPAIIPPMLGKASVSPVVAKQWGAAIEALSTARQVWIIGYSFPPTDTFMLRLLAAGIGANPNLQKLVIIDWQLYSDWKNRLEALFSPMTLQHRVDFFSAQSSDVMRHIAEIDVKKDPSTWASSAKSNLSEGHINTRLHEKKLKDPSIYAP